MLFNEKEMLELCKELNIEVVESKDYPKLQEIELTPDVINSIFNSSVNCNIELNITTNNLYVINDSDLSAA